jgi:hypothetical protein
MHALYRPILLLSVFLPALVFLPVTSLSQCLTAQTARSGYTLVSADGKTRFQVKPFSDKTVTYDIVQNGTLVYTVETYDGIWTTAIITPRGTAHMTMDPDVRNQGPFDVGFHRDYKSRAEQLDGSLLQLNMTTRVLAKEDVQIGACRYTTLVIESESRRENLPGVQTTRNNYSPDLKMNIRSIRTTPDGSVSKYEFALIETK